MMQQLVDKWIAFVNRMNRMGIPVPTVRDPLTGRGSITAALIVFSAGLFGFCILFMLATAVGKWAGFFLLTDATFAQIKTAADYSWQFLATAIGAYLGRFLQKGKPTVPVEPVSPTEKKEAAQKADDPDQQ
jgi:hypothetical protein